MWNNIILINLERRKDRLETVKAELVTAGIEKFEIFEAVDGTHASVQQEYEQQYVSQPCWHPEEHKWKRRLLTNACMYANMLSFLQVVEQAMARDYESLLIFEDDVRLATDFKSKAQSLVKEIGSRRWKIILFGASDFHYHERKKLSGKPCNCYRSVRGVYGAFAVLLHKSIIVDLLKLLRTKRLPPDVCLNVLFERNPMTCYVASPNIAIAHLNDSDIHPFEQNKLQTRVGTDKSTASMASFSEFQTDYYKKTGWNLFE